MQQNIMSCPACHKKIAIEAHNCPHCGLPVDDALRTQVRENQRVEIEKKRIEAKRNRWALLAIFILGMGWSYFQEPTAQDRAASLRRDAVPKCSSAIEDQALYGFEWETRALEFIPRFPYVEHMASDENSVLLKGSTNIKALLFKNAFGVMVPMEYSCLYDTKSRTVVQVHVIPR